MNRYCQNKLSMEIFDVSKQMQDSNSIETFYEYYKNEYLFKRFIKIE